MRDFFKSVRFKVLLAFLAFLIGIMIYSVTKGGYTISGVSFINSFTKPFRSASNGISSKMEGTVDRMRNADDYYEENQRLKAQIGELNQKLTDYEALREEVEELRKFVIIKEEHPDYEISQPADIINYVTNDPFRSFTIDKGSAEGIKVNCPVVTAEGLIGITVEVSEHVSTVRTILSPDLSVAAASASNSTNQGIIEGRVLSAEDGNTRMIHVSTSNTLKEGDLIITAGSSGLFPKDYAVGKVLSISLDPSGLSYNAEIEPCVDIRRLSSVTVITDFSGKKADDDED